MEQRRMEGFPLTANRIQLIALSHFAKYGYAGTSLSKVAEEVGIKKPSIYAHYKSKEDLFLHVLQSVFVDELNWITDFFHKHEHLPLYDQLKLLLDSYRHRYSQYDVLKFMLRVAFFPPPSLQEPVLERMHSFIERLEKGLIPPHGTGAALTRNSRCSSRAGSQGIHLDIGRAVRTASVRRRKPIREQS